MSKDKFTPHYYTTGNKARKIEKFTNLGYEFFFWPHEEQTKLKNKVF